MRYITEIGLTCRFFEGQGASHFVYHKHSGTLPLKGVVVTQLEVISITYACILQACGIGVRTAYRYYSGCYTN